jgi:hypothetical protein
MLVYLWIFSYLLISDVSVRILLRTGWRMSWSLQLIMIMFCVHILRNIDVVPLTGPYLLGYHSSNNNVYRKVIAVSAESCSQHEEAIVGFVQLAGRFLTTRCKDTNKASGKCGCV